MEHTAKEVLQLLKRNGFVETRVRGDHHRFKDLNGNYVSVPYSKLKDSLPDKTYNSILKQAGLK